MKVNINQLKHVKTIKLNGLYSASLIDSEEYEIVKGYGNTIIDALNDMHNNLI